LLGVLLEARELVFDVILQQVAEALLVAVVQPAQLELEQLVVEDIRNLQPAPRSLAAERRADTWQ
jgi:hypothetical protein